MKELFKVKFEGGESRHSAGVACNYMICTESDEELYAEVLYADEADEMSEDEFDDYSYPLLKAEILRQAKKAGIAEDSLTFPYDGIM